MHYVAFLLLLCSTGRDRDFWADIERQAERRWRNPDGYTTSEMEELYEIYLEERRTEGVLDSEDSSQDDYYPLSSPLARGFIDDNEE